VHSLAGRRTRRTQSRGLTLILAAIVAAVTMVAAAPAQAAPNVAKAWGLNQHGELGDGTTEGPEKCGETASAACSTTPVAAGGVSGVTAVSSGTDHSLALLENGTVMAWGSGFNGELGNGATTQSDVPVQVCEVGYTGATPCPAGHYLSGVRAIAGGGGFSLALLADGTVVAWGEIGFAELGDGATKRSDVPVQVCEVGYSGVTPCPAGQYLSGVTAIAAGERFALALVGSSAKVVAWGSGNAGQLGDGSEEERNVPVEVSGLSGVTSIAAGGSHGLALSSGKVMAWGNNKFGDLGDGSTNNSDVPVEVEGLSGVSAIAAGNAHSLALLSDGSVKAWGANANGQLGDGTSIGPETCGEPPFPCSIKPVAVSKASGVTAIAAGAEHSLALLANGAVMDWGENNYGQLGVGTSVGPEVCNEFGSRCSTTPVAVKQAGAIVRGISAGAQFSLAFGPPPPPGNLPEAGRCVKVATGTGKYSGANCLTVASKPSTKKYEWLPAGFTEKLAFSGSGTETSLTTGGHPTIKCIAANITGEWTGPKTASVNVELQGCTNSAGAQCQTVTNPGNKSEIALSGVVGELGFIRYEQMEGKVVAAVGLDLEPQPPMTSLATYECTGSGEAGHVEGSVIGKITPINKMTSEPKVLYYATKAGEQRPEAFQGAPKDTLMTSFTAGLPEESKGSGASSLNIKGESGKNAAPLEIKAR
jgi:alpha-tubulin suppressor-like RCC1 family protein